MTQKLTILFDLDGTLVDTAPDLIVAHNHVMKKFGFPTKEPNEIKSLVGKGANTMMSKTLWNSAKKELSKVKEQDTKEKMVNEFINFYGNNILVKSKLVNGVKEFLIWCKKNNISMGVCTNKQEHLAVDLLKKIGINDFFECVAGSNTFDYCKPDPRHLTNMIEIMNGNVTKSIMIGDSDVDSQRAHNASMTFILLEGGYTDVSISKMKHDHLAKDFVGMEEIVNKYL